MPKLTLIPLIIAVLILNLNHLKSQDRPFISIWQTDSTGTSDDNQIIFPGIGSEYTIEWEEIGNPENQGTVNANNHEWITFPHSGTYKLIVSGNFHSINFKSNETDSKKMIEIIQWGDISWSSMQSAFYGCSNLTSSATDKPNLSNVESMREMFYSARNFNGDISDWDVSNITDMYGLFLFVPNLSFDLNQWDVSSVINMDKIFQFCKQNNAKIDKWDVSSVQTMRGAFYGCDSLTTDLSAWDLSNLEDMAYMFAYMEETDLRLLGLDKWNVSSVTNMSGAFRHTDAIWSDLSRWDVSNVSNFNRMFSESNFNQELSEWTFKDNISIDVMFGGARELSLQNLDKTLIGWANSEIMGHNIAINFLYFGINSSYYEANAYCASKFSVAKLKNLKDWWISGLELACNSEQADESNYIISYNFDPFVAVFSTSNEGSSESNEITLPVSGTDYYVYWQDENSVSNRGELWINGDTTLQFSSEGNYVLTMLGDIDQLNFNKSGDELKIIKVKDWGGISWSNLNSAFSGAKNLTISTDSPPNLMKAHNLDSMFYNASSIDVDLSNWEITNVRSMIDFLSNSGLSGDNYTSTLNSWADNPLTPDSVQLGANGLCYSSLNGRERLIHNNIWTITGDIRCGPQIVSLYPSENQTKIDKSDSIVVEFEEKIFEKDFAGINIQSLSGENIVLESINIDSNLLVINTQKLNSDTYKVSIPIGSLINDFMGENDSINWSFSTQYILSEKQKLDNNHSIYPNPVRDFTTLEFNSYNSKIATLTIYDINGKIVRMEKLPDIIIGQNKIKIWKENLNNGLYFYNLTLQNSNELNGKILIK